jgi:hypothetical protein
MCGVSRDSWHFAASERPEMATAMLALARSISGCSRISMMTMMDEHGVP